MSIAHPSAISNFEFRIYRPPALRDFEFRISNFEFAAPQLESSAGKPLSAWRCCGGPRYEGREAWSAGAR